MNRDLQLTAAGQPYARPYIPVGACEGIDEIVFETLCAADEGDTKRTL